MQQFSLEKLAYEVIKRASTVLPPDIVRAVRAAYDKEAEGSSAKLAFKAILENVELAAKKAAPLCQDTGWPTFHVYHPLGWSTARMRREIEASVAKGVEDSLLRPNAVDPISGKNTETCVGTGIPTFYFFEVEGESARIDVLLKGGGCENTSAQYSLPFAPLKAGRDLEGVRKVVLQAVNDAQGKGCSPAFLGIGIGGDRAYSYALAKKQLFRHIDDKTADPRLAGLEARIIHDANELGIGPMGFGGACTLLGAKIGVASRHPACFFVSVAYFCWASRRASGELQPGGETKVTQ